MKDTLRPSSPALFTPGRSHDPRLGEWVLRLESLVKKPQAQETVVLLGCPDDTGVALNRGRAGAAEGPQAIRRQLYKMTPPMDLPWEETLEVWDAGDIVPSTDILQTHARARYWSQEISAKGYTLVILGGGHDFACPAFTGFTLGRQGTGRAPRFGLLNVDPHLDVRPHEEGLPHSGSAFRDLLENKILKGASLTQFGTCANRNARAHYEFCLKSGVRILTLDSLRKNGASVEKKFAAELKRLASPTFTGVTLDMDSCKDGGGVSAAGVLGFSAEEICRFAALAGTDRRVRYLELAEVAPSLETQDRTARIAAEALFSFLRSRAESLQSTRRVTRLR